ncbi:hypothetical protein MBLNU459_g1853t1 [Dothideomycetes sp. NU459]
MSAQHSGSAANSERMLELTPVEETLRQLLVDVAAYIDDSTSAQPSNGPVTLPAELAKEKLVLRWTGGWVRDKLLGTLSHDIDVAINKMTGFQFGLRMKEYLEIPGNPEKYGLEGVAKNDLQSNKAASNDKSKIVGGLHKIEANPEKSKHLETVTTKILGLDIDLVNLRKETYTEDSRNPQMEFGTPEEDALRRDATVNAMFYNLNTREIEDFTGKGHDDMKNRIIRTPLEPYQTFKDDPLRVLRLIRFASRLNYSIETEAEKWMGDADIKDALQAKISRERVGVELEKMLRGPDPHRALSLIDRLGLYDTIFSDPAQKTSKAYKPDTDQWRAVYDFVQNLLETENRYKDIAIHDPEEQYVAWLLAAIVPYRDAPQPQPKPGKKMPPPLASTIAREGIKGTNKICDIIMSSMLNYQEISEFVRKLSEQKRRPGRHVNGDDATARDVLGMAIRRWGPTWRSQTTFALLVNVADDPEISTTHLSDFELFLSHIEQLDLMDACSMKPLLDGKALAKALSTPPGPWMKDALDVVMAWQLRNPGKTDAKDAIEEVQSKDMHGELTSQSRAVTAQGRKVTTTVLPKKFEMEETQEVTKPWKGRDTYALELLHWILQNSDDRTVEQNWPWVVPPVLSITDDSDIEFKAKGCRLLTLLLDRTSSSLLSRTGLGEVFEQAIMPCLGYLPTLTPEEESVALLSAAYPALISLSRCMNNKIEHEPLIAGETPRHVKFLDDIIRKGVLAAYANCPENIKITEVLLNNLRSINNELGIESVKHLKYVLPMISQVLSHPFGQAYPQALIAATLALQSVILNGWPRMAFHRGEVLKGVTLCWINVDDEHSEEIDTLRKELKRTVLMLKDALKSGCDVEADFAELIDADGRLEGLLRID